MSMRDWFITPKQKFYAAFLSVMTCIFCVLMVMSLGDGTPIATKTFNESDFEKEAQAPEQALTFELKQRDVCMLKIKGLTLNQSWLWVKTLVLDEKDRPVFDYTFNLSYYHGTEGGESWSEGSKSDEKVFVLPKGKYKVLIFGEDEATPTTRTSKFKFKYSNGYSTVERNEKVKVTITKNVTLTRYYMTFFIIFFIITCIFFYIRSERSKMETPSYAYDAHAYPSEPMHDASAGYDATTSHDPNDPNDPHHQG